MTRRKNILLVVMDGCRAQSLGCYGYSARDTSPVVDALAARGAVVDRLYSVSNCTFPALVSMMTGRYPAQHGGAGTWTYYDGRFPFLTDLLRARGYQTFCVMNANVAVSPEWGFIRGYDRAYRAGRESNWFRESAEQRRGVRKAGGMEQLKRDLFTLARRYFPDRSEEVRMKAQLQWYRANDRGSVKAVEAFGRMLQERDRDKPFFMYVNLPDTHSPYFVPDPHGTVFGAQAITRNLLDLNLTPAEIYARGDVLTDDERATLVAMFDTCVRYADMQVGRLLEALDQAGQTDDTIVIVCGDHGGMTYEHRELNGAAGFCYEPEIHVPFVMAGAGVSGRIGGLRSLIDFFPTVLDLAGASADPGPSRSLVSDSTGHDAALADLPPWPRWLKQMVPDTEHLIRYGHGFRAMVKDDGTKLIWVPGGDHEVYDLAVDTGEQRNLYDVARHLPLIGELQDRYEALVGPAGRHLEIFSDTDVGRGLALLPPLDVVNPSFDPASVAYF